MLIFGVIICITNFLNKSQNSASVYSVMFFLSISFTILMKIDVPFWR
jgi:hypothetical protein